MCQSIPHLPHTLSPDPHDVRIKTPCLRLTPESSNFLQKILQISVPADRHSTTISVPADGHSTAISVPADRHSTTISVPADRHSTTISVPADRHSTTI